VTGSARTAAATLVLAVLTALALAVPAGAAYTSPRLTVAYGARGLTRIVVSSANADDATARAAIVIPNGSSVTTTATPGTKVGTALAQVSALALGGALLPLAGDIVVAPPGAVTRASQTACIGSDTPKATFLLALRTAGQTINLPAYVTATTGAQQTLGTSQLVFCLPPPDIPTTAGGATFGAKFLTADLTLNGIIGPVVQGAWVAFWTPWQAGNGQVNLNGSVASPAAIAPGGLTLAGRKVRGAKRLTGRVTQAGAGVAARVSIYGAVGRSAFRRLAVVSAKTNGTFTYAVPKRSKATTFQARVAVVARVSPAVCPRFATLPVPCVNGTLSGFGARSRTVAIR
jgi:hypothetical protein